MRGWWLLILLTNTGHCPGSICVLLRAKWITRLWMYQWDLVTICLSLHGNLWQSVFGSVAGITICLWLCGTSITICFWVSGCNYNLSLTPWHSITICFWVSDWDYNLSFTPWHAITICLWLRGTLLQSVFESVTGITICLSLCGTLLQSVFDSVALYYNLFLSQWLGLQSVFDSVALYYNLSLTPWHPITICLSLCSTLQFTNHKHSVSTALWDAFQMCFLKSRTNLHTKIGNTSFFGNLVQKSQFLVAILFITSEFIESC